MSDDEFDLLAGLIDDQEQDHQQTAAHDVGQSQQVATNTTRSAPRSAAGTSTTTSAATTTAALCTCPYSGYRLRYRISSADTVQISLRNVDIVSVPNLARTRQQRDRNASVNWAVFGVILALELKTTAKAAKMFLSILLTDLNDHTFRLLAFDSAFDRLRSGTEIGHVLCVGNGKLLPSRGGAGPGAGADPATSQLVTISVDDPDQILQIGPCADFVICRGRRKDGRRCTIAVDQRKGGFCSYHVQAAYRSMSSGRMDLQHGAARNTMAGESAAKSGTLAGRTRPGMSPALAALMKPNTKRPRLTVPDPERESKAKDMAIACLGRTASYRTPKVALVAGRPAYVKQTPVLIPVLSKSNPGISGTSLIDLDEDAPDPSVLRAVKELAGRSLKAPDPNSARQPKKLMDISAAINAGRTAPVVKAAPPPRPPSAFTADLRARVSDRKSINAHLVEQADHQEQETRFDMLETREQLADKMQSIASQQVQAHVCHDCKYTLEHQPNTCREMGHVTIRVTVAKTWHKCKICSNRDVALGRHDPGRTCRRCGASNWIRTSMYQGKEVADRPKLQIMTNDRRRLRHD